MKIKDWPKFQHFKDRKPPWIKLYRDLLDDDEWFNLPPQSAKVLVMLWLLASEDETKQGVLPSMKKIAFRCRVTEKAVESTLSQLSHWVIHDDIILSSRCHQLGPSETETYKAETEAKTDRGVPADFNQFLSTMLAEFEQFWACYPKKVGKKDALKAWDKAKDKPVLADILRAIDRAKTSEQWTKENGQFIPNPSTWLNHGRWADEPMKGVSNGHAKIPPFPGPDDPIARGQWRRAYGDPAHPKVVGT